MEMAWEGRITLERLGILNLLFRPYVGVEGHYVACIGKISIRGYCGIVNVNIYVRLNFHKSEKVRNPFPKLVSRSGAAAYTFKKLDSTLLKKNRLRHLYHGND